MQLSNEKPRVLIIGLGSYFNKLRDGIQSYFILEKLLDCKSFEALQLKQADKNKFTQINPNTKEISVDEDIDCIMILTPPVYHVPYVKMLACHQKPILVEKPVAINSSELSQLHHSISENPHLYCSDFYPDVRAIPILTWILPNNDSILKSEINIEGYKQLWDGGLDYLGPIIKIEGKLLEGSGDAATFNGREWLWDPSQGGVLLDLMYHYFTLSSYLFDEEISLEQVKISTLSKNENLIPWNPNLKSSETYALVEGISSSGIPFHFEVSKYWEGQTERSFTLHCKSGTATMLFQNPNILILESNNKKCMVTLKGDYYSHVSRCFLFFITNKTNKPHGLEPAISTIETIDRIKSTTNLLP